MKAIYLLSVTSDVGDSGATTQIAPGSPIPPVTEQTANKQPGGGDFFQLNFDLQEGMVSKATSLS